MCIILPCLHKLSVPVVLCAGPGAETTLWADPVFGAEPGAAPALGVESLVDAGVDEEEPEILGESAGLLGNCGISDTVLLTHTHKSITYH